MSRRIPSLLSPPPFASASGPQMMLLALRAAGLRFGSFPLSKKQSKVGWHSRESNRDVSIRIHNTRYGRQRDRGRCHFLHRFLPPTAGLVPIPKHGVGAQEMLLAIEIAPFPAAAAPTFPIVCRRDGRRARSQAGANVRERAVGILIGVCFGSTCVRSPDERGQMK